MNDKLYLENYLLILKSTVEVYVHGTLESSNSDVRSLLKNSLNEILSSQADTYDKMNELGFYQMEEVSTNVINDTLTKLNSSN